jgi:hypothetical protein
MQTLFYNPDSPTDENQSIDFYKIKSENNNESNPILGEHQF